MKGKKQDSFIAILPELSTKKWPINRPRLSICFKGIIWFYTNLLIKIVTVSCFTKQTNIDHLFAFYELFIASRDLT